MNEQAADNKTQSTETQHDSERPLPPNPKLMVQLYEQMLKFSRQALQAGISPSPLLMQISLGTRRQALLFHLMRSPNGASSAECAEALEAYSSDVRMALEGLKADGMVLEQGSDEHGRARYVFDWDRQKKPNDLETLTEEDSP